MNKTEVESRAKNADAVISAQQDLIELLSTRCQDAEIKNTNDIMNAANVILDLMRKLNRARP